MMAAACDNAMSGCFAVDAPKGGAIRAPAGAFQLMTRRWIAVPGAAAALLVSCHHAPTALRFEGSSSFTIVEPPASAARPEAKSEANARQVAKTLLVARPIEPLAKPIYPPSALGRETLPVTVGVRIIVDAEGRVADVRMSPVLISTPTPRLEEFRAAVEAALAQWRFRPAELRRLAPITDATGAPAWVLLSREKTDYGFDVSFVFQASGEVASRGVK